MIIIEGEYIEPNAMSRPVGLAPAQFVKVRIVDHKGNFRIEVGMVKDVDWNPDAELVCSYCLLFDVDRRPLCGQCHLPRQANYVACDSFVRWFEHKPTFHENLYMWAEDENDVMAGVSNYGTALHIPGDIEPTQTLMRIWK